MIVVTGAAGHLGNVLVRQLVERGETVRVLILPGEDLRALAGVDVELVEGDVLQIESLERAFAGADVVYHLASRISILPGHDEKVWQVNVQGTQNVLSAIRTTGVRRLVYTSSIHALQRIPEGVVIDETIPFDPQTEISDYDRSKATASLAVLEAVREHGVDAVIVCPTGIIGPFDFRVSEMGRLIVDALRRKLNFSVEGCFDFVDVRDVALGHILACERGQTGDFYLLSGEQITLLDLVQRVQILAGVRGWIITVPFRLAELLARCTPFLARLGHFKPRFTSYSLQTVRDNSVICCSKAEEALGYQRRSLQETLADTVQWWQQHFLVQQKAGRGL